MKVFLSKGESRHAFVELPLPEITENDVLVQICYCGICGTDQDLFSGDCSFAKNGQAVYPIRLGHEWSGTVVRIGANVTEFSVGDRVVGDNAITCGACEACLRGDYPHCEHMLNVGTIEPVYDGAFSEYYVIPKHHLHHIPDTLSLKEASLAEPFSVAYGGIKEMYITSRSHVAVIGTGCLGMAAAVLARCLGAAAVYVIGRNPAKLRVAAELGAVPINIRECDAVKRIFEATDGRGADFVLECSGASGTFCQAIEMAAFHGSIGLIGFYENKEDQVDVDAIVSKALHMVGVMGNMENMVGALGILAQHSPNLLPIITDELPFEDCVQGFTRSNYPDAVKIVVRIGQEEAPIADIHGKER